MPIYEFKCLECENVFEMLLIKTDDALEMKCPKCNCENIEKVMSTTHYAVGISGESLSPKAQTRSCSSGSCTTIDLPGYSR
jgi:putative FmdB family regulatory protein